MRRKPTRKLALEETELITWFERDRAHVCLSRARNNATIVEWRDEAVGEAIEDGYLNPRSYHTSAFECADGIVWHMRPTEERG